MNNKLTKKEFIKSFLNLAEEFLKSEDAFHKFLIVDDIKKLYDNQFTDTDSILDGFKIYKCTNCGTINILKDNGKLNAGVCSNCGDQLWN